MDTKLDLTKPVQTRDGRSVRILCMDKKGWAPVIGLIMRPDGYEEVQAWDKDGLAGDCAKNVDLVNAPPPKTVRYINVYREKRGGELYPGGLLHTSQEMAHRMAVKEEGRTPIACIRVEFTEGQFDE